MLSRYGLVEILVASFLASLYNAITRKQGHLAIKGSGIMPATSQRRPEQKRVTITSKRQFTIPQKFYSELGFDRAAVCTMGEGMLIIQPAANVSGGGEFAEQIFTVGSDPFKSLIEVKCSIGARDDLGRPTTTALENKKNFMDYLDTL